MSDNCIPSIIKPTLDDYFFSCQLSYPVDSWLSLSSIWIVDKKKHTKIQVVRIRSKPYLEDLSDFSKIMLMILDILSALSIKTFIYTLLKTLHLKKEWKKMNEWFSLQFFLDLIKLFSTALLWNFKNLPTNIGCWPHIPLYNLQFNLSKSQCKWCPNVFENLGNKTVWILPLCNR